MFQVQVARKLRLAEGIQSFELVPVAGESLPSFSAGAHIDVQMPNGMVRQYSLCNSPAERHRYQIAVLLAEDSRGGSRSLHEDVNEGDRLWIGEPRNLFELDDTAPRSLLLAGGIGITPIMCMAETLQGQGAEFQLHYCGRSRERMAYLDYLQGEAEYADRVRVYSDDGAADSRFDMGLLLAAAEPDTHLYVCGPTGFMDYLLDSAREQGWPESQLHREYFNAVVDAKGDTFELKLASSGLVVRVESGVSAAQALLDAGIDLPISCEQGVCGTCLTRVIDGTPDHRDSYLTPDEQLRNDCFTPCCSRSLSPHLVLDL